MTELPPDITQQNGQLQFPESSCAVCLKGGEILLVRQKRTGRERSLELPGGKVEPSESTVAAALRELQEESGVVARSGKLLISLDLDLSVSFHRTHLVDVSDIEPPHGIVSAEFDVEWVSLEQARAKIRLGEITHAPTVVAILMKASGGSSI